MNNLNKIYFGSAGTGKTREAINQAEKIINEKFENFLFSIVTDCL